MDRRSFLKFTGGVPLALLLPTHAAEAGRQWCQVDPVFRFVNADEPNLEVTASVSVATELGADVDTTGPIQIILTVPEDIQPELLSQDEGFGFGYDIAVETSDQGARSRRQVRVVVAARVPATDRHRVRLEFVPDGAVEDADASEGWTNDWVIVRTRLNFPEA
jgi:hypothetical protein